MTQIPPTTKTLKTRKENLAYYINTSESKDRITISRKRKDYLIMDVEDREEFLRYKIKQMEKELVELEVLEESIKCGYPFNHF